MYFKPLIAVIIFLASFYFSNAGSNEEKYLKLKKLFDEGRYEDCAFKAENFTYNENLKKDPEPHLYLSKCYFELSKMPEKSELYPKAFDDAFKYASKSVKYDKEGTIKKEEANFYDNLKQAGISYAENFFKSGNYSKTAKYLDKVLKIDEEDNYTRLTKGICDVLARNTGEGSMEMNTALNSLNSNNTISTSELSQKLLANAFIKYSEYLTNNQLKDSAQGTIIKAKLLLPEQQVLKNL